MKTRKATIISIICIAIVALATVAVIVWDNSKKVNPTPSVPSITPVTVNPTTTVEPTVEPTTTPIVEPTVEPTAEPTTEPTVEPTAEPTVEPTVEPTAEPTVEPTKEPVEPTAEPTAEPTKEPEPTPEPTPIAEITVENVEAPSGSFYEGKSFNIKGNLSVNIGNIVEVKGFILDTSENILQESSDSPNANSYNLASSKVDKNLKFGKLAAGEYLFKVTLTPEYGKEETIISSRFTVKANVITGITASVSSKTRYIGDSLTASDFTVKAVMSDGSKKKVSGWTAEPLTLGSTSNTITVYYQNFAATVTVAASEKVVVVTPEPTPGPSATKTTPEAARAQFEAYAQGLGWTVVDEDYSPGTYSAELSKGDLCLVLIITPTERTATGIGVSLRMSHAITWEEYFWNDSIYIEDCCSWINGY